MIGTIVSSALASWLPALVAIFSALRLALRPRRRRPDTPARIVDDTHDGPEATAVLSGRAEPRRPNRTQLLAISAVGILVLVSPVVAGLGVMVVWSRSITSRRHARRTRDQAVLVSLADAVDLFVVVLASGTSVAAAIGRAAPWIGGELGEGLAQCHRRIQRGAAVDDSLEQFALVMGPTVRPLTAALIGSERYGTPIIPSLVQLAADCRSARRRHAEAAARRLPVLLLFPLVLCVLPAFVLLTIAPVLVDSFRSFDLLASP